ncbi:MAG TPA: hypothetical protein VMM37_01385 [Bacteroidota bacterium]|nr:hypothetical protein [Bacteroidota bacterium]
MNPVEGWHVSGLFALCVMDAEPEDELRYNTDNTLLVQGRRGPDDDTRRGRE